MRLSVAAVIYQTLKRLDLQYPKVDKAQKQELEKVRQLLLAEKR
jgi:hypothetical protein